MRSNFCPTSQEMIRSEAREILDLGKASYKMRDDDNIFLGRIEAQLEVCPACKQGRDSRPAACQERT